MNADGSSRAKGSMWEKLPAALHRVRDKEGRSSMRTWPGVACACQGALYGAGSCRLPMCSALLLKPGGQAQGAAFHLEWCR